jgi:hypothetical protein
MASESASESEPAGSELVTSSDPKGSTTPASTAGSSQWPDRLPAAAASFYEWLSRPRVRLTVSGVILLLIGGLLTTNSVWTLPLVIAGALMVGIAWIGCRLDGRFVVEWGETGTQLEFRAKIRAAEAAPATLSQAASAVHEPAHRPEPKPDDAGIIDGQAHTIEIEVAELEALIAAAETREAKLAPTVASAQAMHDLRVARGGGRSAHSSDSSL